MAETITNANARDTVALAVDEANGKIYWISNYYDRLYRADASGLNSNIEIMGQHATHFGYNYELELDNANDMVRIYLNGSEVMNTSTTHEPLINSEDLNIGRSQYGEYWDGELDDLRIYNRVLREVDITRLYEMG